MRESDVLPDSWLCGLKHDLHWLGSMDATLYTILQQERPRHPEGLDLTRLIDLWQQDGAWWRKLVKRAWRRHQQQERMMTSARRLNRNILQVLKDRGAEFRGEEGMASSDSILHKCHCGREFTTPQSLATHKRQTHEEYSFEHHLISGHTCACCLQIFWTRQRLQQHLSYVSRRTGLNACFQDLMRRGFDVSDVVDSTADAIPSAFKGLHRKEKLQTFGPFPQGFDLHASKLDRARHKLQDLLAGVDNYPVPVDAEAQAQNVCDSLSRRTHEWFQNFVDSGFDAQLRDELADLWMEPLFNFEDQFDDWYAQILLDWGANGLQDLIQSLLDGEAEILIEEAYADRFGFGLTILSLDTAVAPYVGDLRAHSVSWTHLVRLYRAGLIAGTISGSPCETFSPARHHVPDDLDELQLKGWPRPLRSSERLLGLPGLTMRELRQLSQGTDFALQTILAGVWMVATGGLFVSEHLWKPQQEEFPSIWGSPWIQLLEALPGAHLHCMQQWRWGASVVKPTGMFTIRLPRFAASMYAHQMEGAIYPTDVAIGRNQGGMSKPPAIRNTLLDFAMRLPLPYANKSKFDLNRRRIASFEPIDPIDQAWIFEAAQAGAAIRTEAVFLPDYQGS
eukprot:s750_g31.t1